MELIIGGAFQGKLEYAMERYGLTDADVCDLALTAPLPCLYTIAFPLTALLAALIARSVLQPGILCSLGISVCDRKSK